MISTAKYLRALTLGAAMSVGLVAVTLAPQAALAQAVSGEVTGLVTDQNSAVIVKAVVTATNVETGVAQKTLTNSIGQFRLINLPVGKYDISVSATGFAKSTLKTFAVELNKVSTANFSMKVSASETVEVTTEAGVALDTTTAQLGASFASDQLTELPAATNNVLNIALISAGVATSGGLGQGTGPSVGGQRPTDNNFTLEGIDNNNKSVPGPLLAVPSDAIAEFTTLQNQFSAEYGHSNGGQFNSVVKSGTNQFHGTFYEYSQNKNYNAWDAKQAASLRAAGGPLVKPRYDDNRFGGQIGGPILKKKLFFFANYEQEPLGEQGAASVFCAPTAAGLTQLSGISGISQTNLAIFEKYVPVAATQASATDSNCAQTTQVAGQAIPIGDASVLAPLFQDNYRSTNSLDYTINEKDSLRARYLYNKTTGPDTSALFQTFWTNTPYLYHLATLSEFHVFSPTLTNELRIGYNRYFNQTAVGPQSFPGLDSFPNIQFTDLGIQIGPDPNGPQATVQNTYQAVDSVIWIKGAHTIKTGAEYRDVISPQLFVQRQRGDYEWKADSKTGEGGLAGYLLDLSPNSLGERNAVAKGSSLTYYGNQEVFYSYVNDDWRVNKKLTLNLGVRYEWTGIPEGEKKQALNSAASDPSLISFNSPKSQKWNFVPRFGFAYTVDAKTAVRGGFGMGYDVLYDNLGTLSTPPQFQVTEDVNIHAPTAGFLAGGGLAAVSAPSYATVAAQRKATTSYVPDQKLPYAENFSLGVERTIGTNYSLEARYVGTHGVHLPTQVRMNRQAITSATNYLPFYFEPTAAPTSPTAPTLDSVAANGSSIVSAYLNDGFTSNVVGFMPWSMSNYHSLAVVFKRRFTNGFSFDTAYTWSKTMDDATATTFSTYLTPRRAQDFQHIKEDYSRSALDRTHRLTIAATYEVPFFKGGNAWMHNTVGNWEISPVYTYQSPEYATVQSADDINLNGDLAGDRVFINPHGKKGTGTDNTAITDATGNIVYGYYANDPNAYYVLAGEGTLPNAGRNTLPIRPTNDLDLGITKQINFWDHYQVKFQMQSWNVLNHSQYMPGAINNINSLTYTDGTTYTYLIPGQANFNKPEATFSNNPRSLQLALKLAF